MHIIKPKDTPSTTPLPKKLGIKPDRHLAILGAPDGFKEMLGDLPTTTTRLTSETALALCFVRSLSDLNATIDMLTARLDHLSEDRAPSALRLQRKPRPQRRSGGRSG